MANSEFINQVAKDLQEQLSHNTFHELITVLDEGGIDELLKEMKQEDYKVFPECYTLKLKK